MKSVPRLFADLTMTLEDMHAIAVEGQTPRPSLGVYSALLVPLKRGLARLDRIVGAIEWRIGEDE